MRTVRGRKKKLIVAFHFQFSDPTAWRCDRCRQAGLEIKRRCGWVADAAATPPLPVWARHDVATETCPKSYVTAQSLGWMEQFFVWRRLAYRTPDGLSAREVEAFMILENEMAMEGRRGRE